MLPHTSNYFPMQKNKGAWSWIFSVFSNKSLKIQEIMKLSHKKLKEAFSNGRKKGGFSNIPLEK